VSASSSSSCVSSLLKSSLLNLSLFSVIKRWREEGGIRCNVKNSSKINNIIPSYLSMISAQVVLEITGSCVTLVIASKVENVAWAEVLVVDSIDVIHDTGACDVDLAPVDQFL